MDISRTAVAQAKSKARQAGVEIRFYVGSVLDLPFADDEFDLVFDMGCFHHIHPPDRERFALGIRRVLKDGAHYFMVCFSDKNGPAWNHFSKDEIVTIWSPYLDIATVEHFSSVEGDGYVRFFYATLMQCYGESQRGKPRCAKGGSGRASALAQ
jgi:SAM-dependent methyltransferase